MVSYIIWESEAQISMKTTDLFIWKKDDFLFFWTYSTVQLSEEMFAMQHLYFAFTFLVSIQMIYLCLLQFPEKFWFPNLFEPSRNIENRF